MQRALWAIDADTAFPDTGEQLIFLQQDAVERAADTNAGHRCFHFISRFIALTDRAGQGTEATFNQLHQHLAIIVSAISLAIRFDVQCGVFFQCHHAFVDKANLYPALVTGGDGVRGIDRISSLQQPAFTGGVAGVDVAAGHNHPTGNLRGTDYCAAESQQHYKEKTDHGCHQLTP